MSEAQRRTNYRFDRVLIETQDTLDSDFPDAVVHISGGQLNILRNLMMYAQRIETFVSEYQSGYYLVPTDSEWEALLAVSADLEDTLMGNNNTIWGYSDRLYDIKLALNVTAGVNTLTFDAVPEGKVFRVFGFSVLNIDTACVTAVYARYATDDVPVGKNETLVPATVFVYPPKDIVLKEDDYLKVVFAGCAQGDDIYCYLWGYEMDVPT